MCPPRTHHHGYLVNRLSRCLGRGLSHPTGFSGIGVLYPHGAHAPILPGVGLQHLAQPVGRVVILGLGQMDDVADNYVPHGLHPLLIQHPPAEYLLHLLLPELLLHFRDELQPLSQVRRLFKLHPGYLHGGPA